MRLRHAIRLASALAISLLLVFLPCSSAFRSQLQAEGLPQGQADVRSAKPVTAPPPRPSGAEDTQQKQNKILERETALSLKEKELQSLSENLSARIQQLQQARKEIEGSLDQKKKDDTEKYKKMLKLYKSLRPEEAAALIDKLDEDMAFEMLNQMDTKTAVKLIPLLNQERVLKWTRLSLNGK